MDFKDLVQLARRRWKSIASMFLLALIAASAFTLTATPIYHSEARVFISTDTSDANEAYFASAFSTNRVKSYADLVTSGAVMEEVIDQLDLDLTPKQLAEKTSAAVQADTVIILIESRDTDPRLAQQIAQAEAEVLVDYLDTVETPKGKDSSPVKATITDEAQFDGAPIAPRPGVNLAAAGILGLLVGGALAVARDLLDNTVKTPDDVKDVTGSAILTHVAMDPNMDASPLLTDLGPHDPRTEAFRLLRTNLQFLDLGNPPRSFVITSAVPGEGKTSISTNLAIALAQTGNRVVLVDGDLRRPMVAEILGLESNVGLTTALVGMSSLDESLQRHAASGIDVLTSGPLPPNPTEVLQSEVTRRLLEELSIAYDVVVIDGPPLLPVADAAIMATDVDGALLVVRHGKTTREQLQHAMTRLQQVDARLFGTVVNMSPRRKRSGYGDGYGYGYEAYGYAPAKKKDPKPPKRRERKVRASANADK